MAKFPKEVLVEYILNGSDSEEDGIKFVESGPWEDEGKYSYRRYIFEHGGKFYSVSDARSGSYFSDYYYEHRDWADMVDCTEVEKVSITVTEWRRVNVG